MKLVIDITDEMWQAVQDGWVGNDLWHNAIENGTPLPKGHGRLIDADDLEHITVYSKTRNSGITRIEAPTIIEPDTESEV